LTIFKEFCEIFDDAYIFAVDSKTLDILEKNEIATKELGDIRDLKEFFLFDTDIVNKKNYVIQVNKRLVEVFVRVKSYSSYTLIIASKFDSPVLKDRLNVFLQSPVVIFEWKNSPDWRVRYVSENVESIYGYSVEDFLLGKIRYIDVVYRDDLERVSKEVEVNEKFDFFEHKPYRIVDKLGKIKWVFDKTNVIRDENQEIKYFYGYIIDITKRVEAEIGLTNLNMTLKDRVKFEIDKQREQERMLLEQSKFAQMGQMLVSLSHHWRQPLNTIALLVQDIEEEFEYGNLNKSYLKSQIDTLMNKIESMSSVIDNFRNLFKSDFQREKLNVKNIIEESLILIDDKLVTSNIKVNIVGDDFYVLCFKNKLKQAILNIIDNAKDSLIEKRGLKNIDIELENRKIYIRDSSDGIPPDILNRVFEPYFSTKENRQGLGLYISKVIFEEIDGRVAVENLENGFLVVIDFERN